MKKKRNIIVIIHCLLALSLFTACQPAPVSRLSIDDIVGTWRMELADKAWGPWMFLNEDGTFAFTNVPNPDENPIADQYSVKGRYELEGNTITFHHDMDGTGCPGGVDSWKIEITKEGKLQGTLLEADCQPPFPGPIYIFSRLSP